MKAGLVPAAGHSTLGASPRTCWPIVSPFSARPQQLAAMRLETVWAAGLMAQGPAGSGGMGGWGSWWDKT